MKFSFILFLFITSLAYCQLPKGFVYAKDYFKDLEVDLRYFSTNNFIGTKIEGYNNNCLILTKEAVNGLIKVQKELKLKNIGLKVYDGYRPQRAVNYFGSWAKRLNDTVNKSKFYPDVKKEDLFKEEYIAAKSGHSKGSTVDVTLIYLDTKKELDMGSRFDFFGIESWVNYNELTQKQKENRALLQNVMLKNGFKNYTREWWHFTLKDEPFPNTYFDFPVE